MLWGTIPGVEDSIPEDNYYTVGDRGDHQAERPHGVGGRARGIVLLHVSPAPIRFLTLVVQTAADPVGITPSVRETVTRLDPQLPLFGVETMEQRVAESLISRRAPMMLLGVFAGVAVFLAVIGIYGALSYSVTQRTRELGIGWPSGARPETSSASS